MQIRQNVWFLQRHDGNPCAFLWGDLKSVVYFIHFQLVLDTNWKCVLFFNVSKEVCNENINFIKLIGNRLYKYPDIQLTSGAVYICMYIFLFLVWITKAFYFTRKTKKNKPHVYRRCIHNYKNTFQNKLHTWRIHNLIYVC